MVNIEDVYKKFGEASEVAQLLETELGTLLLQLLGTEKNLFEEQRPDVALNLLNGINKATLGQLIKRLDKTAKGEEQLVNMFSEALKTRNRLAHGFYLEHGLRRNSPEGCSLMIADLDQIHSVLLEAYKASLLLSGIDIEQLTHA